MQFLKIKRTMARVATVLLMLLTTATAWAQDAIDGLTYNTSGGYYEIKDAQDLIDLANYVKGGGDTYGKTFKQTANITFEHTSDWNDTSSGERNFEGIGDFFKGDYYGQGFTISGLRMSYGHGIFYCAYGAIIDGIVLADSRITNNENVGGIVGYTYENIEKDSKPAIVNNCHVRSDVLIHNASGAKAFKIGGVVGHNAKYCQVTNCTSSATITGRTAGGRRESIGGIVGENRGTVSNNFAFDVTIGNIDSYYGAIVGENTYLAILSNNYYFNCTVSGLTSDIGCNGADVTTDNGAYNLSPAHFEQTGTNEYTIHSAEGWGVFCDLLANSNKGYFTGKTVKLGNDIQISRAAGLDQHDFTGTFDGQGNTIKLAFGTSQNRYTEHAAVFRNTEWASSEQYAKIQNLNVNGTIYTASNVIYDAGLVAKAFGGLEISNCTSDVIINTSNQFAGGFVGYNQGKLNIVNCRSNATIYSTVNGDGTHGGFVGNHHSGELTIEGCVFTGKLLTTATNSTAYCGGFVGWCNTATTIKNCLYAPAIIDTEHGETEVQAGTGDYTSATFCRNGATITNSYYTRTLGTAQGKQARTVEAGDYVTVSLSGMATEYNVSGITAYKDGETQKPGLLYNGTIYAGSDDQVSLTLSHADRGGYTFTDYTASAGTLEGTTLTMPDQNVNINANYEFTKFTQGALSYECTSGTEVKVTACDNSLTSVTIPATVTYDEVTYNVTAIGNAAFDGCTSLTTVFMRPTTPPTLGNDAFANCDELANIYVPAGTVETYKTTGNWATYKDIIQIDGTCGDDVYWSYDSDSHKLTIFGTGAMADYNDSYRPWEIYCYHITTVDIRDGVTTIGDRAFRGCHALSSIDIPASVTTIGEGAFSYCTGLTSITIPASVTSIGDWAFNTCDYLTSITIPAGVTNIGDGAFAHCSSLESIYVAEGNTVYDSRNGCNAIIKKDGNILLWGCKNTVIPTGVISIGDYAFFDCTGLTSIDIPASVTSIGNDAFADCTGLSAFTVDEGNTIYAAEDGVLFNKDKTTLILYPLGNNRTSYTIPNSVTTIGDGAFACCTGLTSITIPACVTSIGNDAFGACTSLTSITIPACVTSIGWSAFDGCESLSKVYCLATTPPTLGEDAFYDFDNELSIYVPTASLDDYKTAWADYKDKIKGLDEITEIALADNASNSDLIAAVNGQTHNVTLQGRTLVKDGNWNTLCLPFDVTAEQIAASPLAGATIKEMDNSASGTSLDTGTLTLKFNTVTAITAGKPYIIKWTETGENIVNPVFTGVTISSTEPTPVTSTDGKVTFVGQYSPFSIVESGATGDSQGNKNEIIMLSSNNKLGYSKNPRTLHTFRCHFYVPTNDSQQQARSFNVDFGDGETTGFISTTNYTNYTNSDAWYTIDGRQLTQKPTAKGMYINKGHKVVIK